MRTRKFGGPFRGNMGVSKNGDTPKMDGENNGKPENPVKMDDLGVPLFSETPICRLYTLTWQC